MVDPLSVIMGLFLAHLFMFMIMVVANVLSAAAAWALLLILMMGLVMIASSYMAAMYCCFSMKKKRRPLNYPIQETDQDIYKERSYSVIPPLCSKGEKKKIGNIIAV